jgi:hypothetical protein
MPPSVGTARRAAAGVSTSSKSGTGSSQTLLNRPEGTVAPVDGDEHALGHQGANRYAKPPVPVARQRAEPDIRDRQQEAHGDRAVDSAERARW